MNYPRQRSAAPSTKVVRAAKQISEREWRFVSPEFYTDKKTGEITKLAAVALVNRPAFKMTALARANSKPHGETNMFKVIAKALGLPTAEYFGDVSGEQARCKIRLPH